MSKLHLTPAATPVGDAIIRALVAAMSLQECAALAAVMPGHICGPTTRLLVFYAAERVHARRIAA